MEGIPELKAKPNVLTAEQATKFNHSKNDIKTLLTTMKTKVEELERNAEAAIQKRPAITCDEIHGKDTETFLHDVQSNWDSNIADEITLLVSNTKILTAGSSNTQLNGRTRSALETSATKLEEHLRKQQEHYDNAIEKLKHLAP